MIFPTMCDQQSLRSACAYAQSDQCLCRSFEHSMSVKLLTEHHLEFLSLQGGCPGSSESTLVKMSHCSKSRVVAQDMALLFQNYPIKYMKQQKKKRGHYCFCICKLKDRLKICIVSFSVRKHDIYRRALILTVS